jgi:hypothetical protein
MKHKFLHEPQYFQFYVTDGKQTSVSFNENDFISLQKDGFISFKSGVVISVVSDFSIIPIDVEIVDEEPSPNLLTRFDKVSKTKIDIPAGSLILSGSPGGPTHGKFGEVPVKSGLYNMLIGYGGQNSQQPDGETKDYYSIYLWPEV